MHASLDKAKQILKNNNLHVKFSGHAEIQEVHCKGCGVKIAGQMISDVEPQQVVLGKRTVTVVPMTFVRLNTYAEGTMQFDDGSAHVTMACKKCIEEAKKSDDPKMLMDWYLEDIAVWLKEIELTGLGEIHPLSLNRTPVRLV